MREGSLHCTYAAVIFACFVGPLIFSVGATYLVTVHLLSVEITGLVWARSSITKTALERKVRQRGSVVPTHFGGGHVVQTSFGF